ncbi:MAG: DeoR/GlpR family DNA-binding transcription regulator [Devosiaceae bacterium]|nr:DeoR/GlpR family DNA-binding transcription regulator [Devosiaceae bacterium]
MANQQKPSIKHKTHRAHELLETLKRLGGSARNSQMADTMGVSEETIRRTVKKLSKEGVVSRVHGGVYLAEAQGAPSFHARIGERTEEKRRMAHVVAEIIEDGASLFLDVGSTTLFVAEALRSKSKLTIVTNSLSIAQTLMNHNQNRVFIAGGELNNSVGGTFGASARKFVSNFRADFAILSADALDVEQGFLVADEREAELARTFVDHARKSIMVADASKADQVAPMVTCDPNEIDIFISDTSPGRRLGAALKGWKIDIIVAPAKSDIEKKKKSK